MENISVNEIMEKIDNIPAEKWEHEVITNNLYLPQPGSGRFECMEHEKYIAKLKKGIRVECDFRKWDWFGTEKDEYEIVVSKKGKTLYETNERRFDFETRGRDYVENLYNNIKKKYGRKNEGSSDQKDDDKGQTLEKFISGEFD